MSDTLKFATFATGVNTVTCVVCSIFLYTCLYVHANLDSHLVEYDDNSLEIYVKVTDITMHFIWFVMQAVGILICIRATIGIMKLRIHLVAQFLIWKVVEIGSFILHLVFGANQHYENSDEASLGSLRFYFPIIMLAHDVIMLTIVWMFYKNLPHEDSSSDEDV